MLAHDVFEGGDPGARGRFLLAALDPIGLPTWTAYRRSPSRMQNAGTMGTRAARASRNGPSGNGAS